MFKSGKTYTDADCLSRSPIESTASPHEDETPFLGVLDAAVVADQQRDDPELLALINFLDGRAAKAPSIFAKGLSSLCLRNDVLYKRNFSPIGCSYLIVVPTPLRSELLQACHSEVT